MGSRDADRERGAFAAGRADAGALARRARESHTVSERFLRPHGGPWQAVEGVAPPLLPPAGGVSAASHHSRHAGATFADRDGAAPVGARGGAVRRLLVDGRGVDARAARPGRHGAGPAEPVSRRAPLHAAEYLLRRGGTGDRDAALRGYVAPGPVATGLGRGTPCLPGGAGGVDRGGVRP